jgi:hypothetical protein
LSEITQKNHAGYCARHGYKYECLSFDYENFNANIVDHLKRAYECLKRSDILMMVGADTMFLNWRIKIEDLLRPEDRVLVAREQFGWWPINNDVMIYRNTPEALGLFRRLIDDFEVWKHYPLSVQAHLWNLLQEDESARSAVRVVDAKVMNQHPNHWQLGDFIVHFYGLELPEKIRLAKNYNARFGGGSATWKEVKTGLVRPEVA